ncbi:hypothetical protein DPEC_G00115950 [Dallia pectoralis]|uniref:Uncharacterized protein n=1 Tax=Dallia pectoralis TaxID=75939 RepID=A0ACC2GV31_DALPE|nr:hypothetical protein DPEC_G00115950 [Dallia pectoralis]
MRRACSLTELLGGGAFTQPSHSLDPAKLLYCDIVFNKCEVRPVLHLRVSAGHFQWGAREPRQGIGGHVPHVSDNSFYSRAAEWQCPPADSEVSGHS